VATRTVSGRVSPRNEITHQRAMKRAPKSLNASVGRETTPECGVPGDSDTKFMGKLIASLTTCQSTSSGTSGAAKGFCYAEANLRKRQPAKLFQFFGE